MKKHIVAFIVGFFISSAVAFGASVVDQGAPGNQGPWSVKFVAPVFPADGGTATTSSGSYPYACATSSPNKVTYQDGGVQNVPGTAIANRLYTVVCNSRDNTTGNLRCRADGTAPTNATGAVGDVLGVGDCIPYTNPSGFPVKCIGSNLWVTSYECVR